MNKNLYFGFSEWSTNPFPFFPLPFAIIFEKYFLFKTYNLNLRLEKNIHKNFLFITSHQKKKNAFGKIKRIAFTATGQA